MIYVDIVSDTICPWCYIGKRRFERALELSGRTDVAVAWRPFQLNPDMPAEGMTRDDYVRAKFGGGDRPRQIYQAIAESGREAGIEFQFSRIKRTPNTVLSHRLVHWSAKSERAGRGRGRAVQGLFRGRPRHRRSRHAGRMRRARRHRRDTWRATTSTSDEGRQEVVASDVYARRLGINGVPCFIVNRKYAVSGAQPPSAFVEVFNLAERDAATSAAQSTAYRDFLR